MRKHSVWGSLQRGLWWFNLCAAVIVGVAGGLVKSRSATFVSKPVVREFVAWTQPYAEWIILVGPALIAGSVLLEKRLGQPWVWGAVHKLLDQLQEYVFRVKREENPEVAKHDHSVTLFKHVKFRWAVCKWPWSGWLVPVERSGNLRRRCGAAFLAPDEGTGRAEGIAGQVWATEGGVISRHDLPDLSGSPDDAAIADFAEKTYISVPRLKGWIAEKRAKHQQMPRSLCGYPVEAKDGRLWGVIVLDSTDPNDLKTRTDRMYPTLAKHLTQLIERV